mmetsp:Transcript_34715/g.38384  ORF Transcript_34715/g.38384 Transcript_34715/m.38384 type:complete len:84 (-) Transcript_34715:70-321(-)
MNFLEIMIIYLDGIVLCPIETQLVYGPYLLNVLEERILLRAKKGSRQSDDNIKSKQNCFRTFEEMTVPVVETLQKISNTSKNS